MIKNALISVVISAYNHEQYIEECIDSIINQTYENIELIILNDGSNDKTAEKINSKSDHCKKRFKRFLFIDKENEGLQKTLNRGCFKSNGEFLALIGSDDSYESNAIETLYEFLKHNSEYVLAVGNNYFMDSQSKRCYWDGYQKISYNIKKAKSISFASYLKKTRKDVDFYSDEFGKYQSLLKSNYIPNGCLIKRDTFINKVGGYSEKNYMLDWFLNLQLSKFGKFKYIDKHLYNYRCHKENLSKNKDKMLFLSELTIKIEKDYAKKFGFEKTYIDYMQNLIKKSNQIKIRKFYFMLKKFIYRRIKSIYK
jgi:alpha-1,3-rhamnosyltransferase